MKIYTFFILLLICLQASAQFKDKKTVCFTGDAIIHDYTEARDTIWLATSAGIKYIPVNKVSDAAYLSLFKHSFTECDIVTDIEVSPAGELYALTDEGTYLLKIVSIKDIDTIPLPEKFFNLHIDASGLFWSSIDTRELISFDGVSIKHYRNPRSAYGHFHNRFLEKDEQGRLYFETRFMSSTGTGIEIFDNGTWTSIEYSTNGSIYAVSAIRPDSFWIATSSGAAHYDGSVFTVYNKNSGLNADTVFHVLPYKGETWLATTQGVSVLDSHNLVKKNYKIPELNGPIESICKLFVDSEENMWFSSKAYGLYLFTGNSWTKIPVGNAPFTSNDFQYIVTDQQGNTFAGHKEVGFRKHLTFYSFDGENWQNRYFPPNSKSIQFYDLAITSTGGLLTGSGYDGAFWKREDDVWLTLKQHDVTLAVTTDSMDRMYIPVSNTSIGVYKNGSWSYKSRPSGSKIPESLYATGPDNIWVGTGSESSSGEIEHYNGSTWETITSTPFLTSYGIGGITGDKSGQMYFGSATYDGKVYKFDGQSWQKILKTKYVRDMHMDSLNNIWIASKEQGIVVHNPSGLNFTEQSFKPYWGQVYRDINRSGTKDFNEDGIYRQKVHLEPENIITTTDPDGFFYFDHISDSSTVRVIAGNLYETSGQELKYLSESAFFGLTARNSSMIYYDLETVVPTCNESIPYWTTIENLDSRRNYVDYARLTYSSTLTETYSEPVSTRGTNYVSYQYRWIHPGENHFFRSDLKPGLTEGDSLAAILSIPFEGFYFEQMHYDTVINRNVCDTSYNTLYIKKEVVDSAIFLNIKVEFQNTVGTEVANLIITDSLTDIVIPESFEIISSSHHVKAVLADSILNFHFDDITLADHLTSFPGSLGYIKYRIRMTQDNYSPIQKQVTLSFDENEIETNVVEIAPPVVTSYPSMAKSDWGINIYPNPAKENFMLFSNKENSPCKLSIMDNSGKVLYQEQAYVPGKPVNIEFLAAGLYFIKVNRKDTTFSTCLLKN